MLFFDEGSSNAMFSKDKMCVFSVDLNNINLDDPNFYEDDPKTIIHVRRLVWHNKPKQRKSF